MCHAHPSISIASFARGTRCRSVRAEGMAQHPACDAGRPQQRDGAAAPQPSRPGPQRRRAGRPRGPNRARRGCGSRRGRPGGTRRAAERPVEEHRPVGIGAAVSSAVSALSVTQRPRRDEVGVQRSPAQADARLRAGHVFAGHRQLDDAAAPRAASGATRPRRARNRASLADPQPGRPHPHGVGVRVPGDEEDPRQHPLPVAGPDAPLDGPRRDAVRRRPGRG